MRVLKMNNAKEIVVLSGKGGAGKTTLTLALVKKFKNKVIADTDVDAADMFIVMDPKIVVQQKFTGNSIAKVDKEKCTGCGICEKLCRFDAIHIKEKTAVVDEVACDGCTLCEIACPVGAITMEPEIVGEWFISKTKDGDFVHAKLHPGGENSGNLVAMVKQQAKIIAEKKENEYILIDGPPGIGCPVTSSLSGSQMAVLVTEPSVSALHDLKRIRELAKHFKVKTAVVINRCDVNLELSREIEDYCAKESIKIIGRIKFDKCISTSLNKRQFPYGACEKFSKEIDKIYENIVKEVENA